MHVTVYTGDLKPEHECFKDYKKVSFEMFTENAQAAIRAAGWAVFQFGGAPGIKIMPPTNPPTKEVRFEFGPPLHPVEFLHSLGPGHTEDELNKLINNGEMKITAITVILQKKQETPESPESEVMKAAQESADRVGRHTNPPVHSEKAYRESRMFGSGFGRKLPPDTPQLSEDGAWSECHCTCHRNKVRHCMPCCVPCPDCGMNVVGSMAAHKKQLHPQADPAFFENIGPTIKPSFDPARDVALDSAPPPETSRGGQPLFLI
jgi:hypothetical protein